MICAFRAAESAKKRGLTLAFEGLPRRPFEGLAPSEEAIAQAAYQETKEKLKNPNIFVNKSSKSQAPQRLHHTTKPSDAVYGLHCRPDKRLLHALLRLLRTGLCIRNLPNWADANFLREKISGLLAPILKAHAESPAAVAAAAVAAAAAEQSELGQQKPGYYAENSTKPQQQQKKANVGHAKEWKTKAAAAIKKAS